jgi:DNA modification methylase
MTENAMTAAPVERLVIRLIEPVYDEAGVTIYNADCEKVLPWLDAVDLVLTDPPYGVDACNQTLGKGKKQFVRGDWDKQRPRNMWQVVDAGRYACIWGGNYFADVLPPTNDWLIWHKANDDRSFSEVEMAWTNYGKQSRHKTHHWGGEQKRHPTQKPLAVMQWALGMAPDDVQTVLDPFMGSGTTLVAAHQAGLRVIGIEASKEYCDIAIDRLRQRSLFAV